jgi:ribosome-associated protein
MEIEQLKQLVIDALEDLKGKDIKIVDVRGKSSITDIMVIVSGTSDRHLKSLANSVISKAKQAGVQPLGVEGENSGEWVLVDLGDVVVHVMMPAIRDFYNLEKLWETSEPEQEQQEQGE